VIVIDTNLIAYLFINGDRSAEAEKTYVKDPEWTAPLLWRSEFRSVLVKCMRKGVFGLDDAVMIARQAEAVMAGREYAVESGDVLRIAEAQKCSAYDAEFAALAKDLGVPLVTADARLQIAFPGTAVSPAQFAAK
jgi:predicted nucleic acid-binding protein